VKMYDIIEFFMDPLRLILIIAGVVVLLAIVIFSRKFSKRSDFVYGGSSSKEFSFGSHINSNVSDTLAQDILIDEEVVVLPRKKKQSEASEMDSSVEHEATAEKARQTSPEIVFESLEPLPRENAYNVRTEPRKTQKKAPEKTVNASGLDKFEAFQAPVTNESIISDVFNDDVVASSLTAAEVQDTTPQFQRVDAEKLVTDAREKSVESKAEPKIEEKQESATTSVKETFIVLHVVAGEGQSFNGLDILDATKTQGLAFGKHAIFHYPMSAAPAGDSKFCLVNMSPEGNFKTNKISSLNTQGMSLIMRLPIRGANAMTVFLNMVGVAQALARKLGGKILDQTRIPLTPEIVESLKSDIIQFENSNQQVAPRKDPVPEL